MITETQRTRVFWAINLYHCVNDAIVFLLPTVMATFYRLFELTFTQTSIIFASNLGMIILMQLINGYLVDKHFEKPLFFIGMISTGLSTFLLMFAHDFMSLWLFALINGFGLGFVHALVYVFGARLYPQAREIKLAIQGSMGDIGKLCSIISSAIILTLIPSAWQIPFLIWGTLIFIVFIYVLWVIPKFPFNELTIPETKIEDSQTKVNGSRETTAISMKEKVNNVNPRRTLIYLFLLFICYSGAQEIIFKPLTLYLTLTRTGPSSEYAEVLFAFFLAAGTLGSNISGRLKTRFGMRKFMGIVFFNMTVGLTLFVFLAVDNFIIDLIFILFLGFNVFSVYITIQSEFTFYINFKRLGLGYGLLLGIGWFGGFIAMLLVGPIADLYGPRMYLIIAAILSLFTLMILYFIPNRNPQK